MSGSTADSTRENIRASFNSPFFPNVLVSTSVFQEGVNLHLNCSQVHHYGIAHSAGDSEQRVGRVDRLFGRINRNLQDNNNANLTIEYPFLKGTFDEKQLVSFLKTKDKISAKMDECLLPEADSEIEDDLIETVKTYLHVPEKFKGLESKDPYPADRNISPKIEGYKALKAIKLVSPTKVTQEIQSASRLLDGISTTIYHYDKNDTSHLLYIDAQRTSDKRHQAVIVEQHYTGILLKANTQTGGNYLRLKSPLASKADLDGTEERLLNKANKYFQCYSLPKLCIDTENDGCFYAYLAVDLPIFSRKDGSISLSIDEIKLVLEQLIHCTDKLEKSLLNTDFKCEDISNKGVQQVDMLESSYQSRKSEKQNISSEWQHIQYKRKREKQAVVYSNLSSIFIGDWQRCAIANHSTPFINHLLFGEENHVGVCYPNMDFQIEEQQLLLTICKQQVALEQASETNENVQVIIELFESLTSHNNPAFMQRVIWQHAYKLGIHLNIDLSLTRQKMRTFIESVATELATLSIRIPFWEKGWANRADLFDSFSEININEGSLGLVLINECIGEEIASSWRLVKRLSDYNLIMISHSTNLQQPNIRCLSLDKIMIRNDELELVANYQRPYQIRPMDYLVIEHLEDV